MLMNNYSYIQHTGIKGMKWGQRRYQNEDGTLTPAGKIRYGKQAAKQINNLEKKATRNHLDTHPYKTAADHLTAKADKMRGKQNKYQELGKDKKTAKLDAKINKIIDKASKYKATLNSLDVDSQESRTQALKILTDAQAKGITFKTYHQRVSNGTFYTYTGAVKVNKKTTKQNG